MHTQKYDIGFYSSGTAVPGVTAAATDHRNKTAA